MVQWVTMAYGAAMSWHKADAQAIASHAYAIDNIITRKFPPTRIRASQIATTRIARPK